MTTINKYFRVGTGLQFSDGSTVTNRTELIGPKGDQGDPGTAINIIGTVADVGIAPQTTLNSAFPGAVAGNSVIDETSGDLWVYSGTTWTNVGQIKGDKGDKGDQGDPGSQGNQGDPGDKGDKGDPGDKGDKGDPGDKGDKGDPGDKGDKGDPGDKGDKGDQGDPGISADQDLNTTDNVTFNSITVGTSGSRANIQTYTTSNITGSTATSISGWNLGSFSGAKYIIHVVDDLGMTKQTHTTEMIVNVANGDVFETEYGITTSNDLLGEFNNVIEGGDVILMYTPAGVSNARVRVFGTFF